MSAARKPRPVVVFSPDPLLSITIEPLGEQAELHVHAAGQGVWVARSAAESGASTVLCCLLGGEIGSLLRPLLEHAGGELRAVPTSAPNGSYVVDHRGSDRMLIASCPRPVPRRHELDNLLSATCTAALSGSVLVLCNPYPVDGVPDSGYEMLAANAAEAGVPVIVDLSTPRLDRTLAHRPALVKINDWELAEYVRGPVDGARALSAARELIAAGAQNVAVTRAEAPILVVPGDAEPFEIVPPPLTCGFREGCGDTMTGAVAAAWARGARLRDALTLGAAAGSVNYLRRGLGTGGSATVQEMVAHIGVRPVGSLTPAADSAR